MAWNSPASSLQRSAGILAPTNLTTTTDHSQTNEQNERYNRTTVTRLRKYVASCPRDWGKYVPSLTYAYNTKVHRSTQQDAFFRHLLTCNTSGPASISSNCDSSLEIYYPPEAQPLQTQFFAFLMTLRAVVRTRLARVGGQCTRDHEKNLQTSSHVCTSTIGSQRQTFVGGLFTQRY